MQSHRESEAESYYNHPSRSSDHGFDAAPKIFIDFVTEMSSSQYPSSNEGILTPQDSNSMDDQVRGSVSGAGYTERSEGSLNEYAEIPESLTMSYHGDLNRFNAGLGTQFDTEGGYGSQTMSQVDAAVTREQWNDENGVPLYRSVPWPRGCASTVLSQNSREYYQPREMSMLSRVDFSSSQVLDDHTYQYHVCGPTHRYDPGLPGNSQPWSTYSVTECRSADPPPSDESLFGTLDANGIHASIPSYHIAKELPHEPRGTRMDCLSTTASMFNPSSNIDVTEETPLGTTMGPQRKGGRSGPLNDISRENAKLRRSERSCCWHCARLRIKCVPSEHPEICWACWRKRPTSPIKPCLRTWIPDLTEIFLPSCLLEQHTKDKLRAFCRAKVFAWTENQMLVQVTCGIGKNILCLVQEIQPNGTSLLMQKQYRKNLDTNEYDLVPVPSPPIGMRLIQEPEWRRSLENYLDDLLQNGFHAFPEVCIQGTDCEVQRDLLHVLHKHYLLTNDPLLGLSLKLVVVTYIMTHCWTLVEDTRDDVYRQLNQQPRTRFGIHTCPRWLNKQLKYLMASLHQVIMRNVLQKFHQILRNSSKASWATAFATLLLLSMTTESMQVAVRCKEDIDVEEELISQWSKSPTQFVVEMDSKLDEVVSLFHAKYGNFDPTKPASYPKNLESPSRDLAEAVNRIVGRHRGFLEDCKGFDGPPMESAKPKNSRLVAKFLLRGKPFS